MFRGIAFVSDKNIQIKKRSDLAKYNIGILRGSVFADRLTKGFKKIRVETINQLVRMLMNKHIDVIVLEETETRIELAKNFPDSQVKALSPPLIETPIYHYIHKSKRDLVDKIEIIISQMQANGELIKFGSQLGK